MRTEISKSTFSEFWQLTKATTVLGAFIQEKWIIWHWCQQDDWLRHSFCIPCPHQQQKFSIHPKQKYLFGSSGIQHHMPTTCASGNRHTNLGYRPWSGLWTGSSYSQDPFFMFSPGEHSLRQSLMDKWSLEVKEYSRKFTAHS